MKLKLNELTKVSDLLEIEVLKLSATNKYYAKIYFDLGYNKGFLETISFNNKENLEKQLAGLILCSCEIIEEPITPEKEKVEMSKIKVRLNQKTFIAADRYIIISTSLYGIDKYYTYAIYDFNNNIVYKEEPFSTIEELTKRLNKTYCPLHFEIVDEPITPEKEKAEMSKIKVPLNTKTPIDFDKSILINRISLSNGFQHFTFFIFDSLDTPSYYESFFNSIEKITERLNKKFHPLQFEIIEEPTPVKPKLSFDLEQSKALFRFMSKLKVNWAGIYFTESISQEKDVLASIIDWGKDNNIPIYEPVKSKREKIEEVLKPYCHLLSPTQRGHITDNILKTVEEGK